VKLVKTFVDTELSRGQRGGSYDRVLGFLDRRSYLFFQLTPHCTHEAEFQTHYFSENLVAAGIETGPLGL
jgi:hypothetical protein